MPVRPQPFNLRCTVCNWTAHCRPSSDCFTPLEVPTHCRRCASTHLQMEHGKYLYLKAVLRTHFGMY